MFVHGFVVEFFNGLQKGVFPHRTVAFCIFKFFLLDVSYFKSLVRKFIQ